MIKEKIEEFYQKKNEKKDRASYFYCSECGNCSRSIFYDMKGFPKEPISSEGLRRMANGQNAHIKIVTEIFSSGVQVVASEASIPDNEQCIHGRIDLIVSVNLKDGPELIVVDVKTINDYAFKLLKTGKSGISYNYLVQMQLYLHFLKLKRGLLLFESKNTNELLEKEIIYSQEFVENIFRKLKNLKDMINNNMLPAKEECDACRWCNFKEICKNDQKMI